MGPLEALEAAQAETLAQRPSHAFLAGGDVRMGDFVLLVDSDTRVPQDCILPVVSELLRSPHVAFTQHFTTPLQLSFCYFENGMANFTSYVYSAIRVRALHAALKQDERYCVMTVEALARKA